MAVEYKQDMPPPSGYAPITYQRVPIKKGLSAVSKLGVCFGITAVGYYYYLIRKDKINNDRIEMRCAKLALTPMIRAETDRQLLKQLKKNRDEEERIMKNVKDWEVGKWRHSPVYLTLDPDEYFRPSIDEFFAHSDMNVVIDGIMALRAN